jgi:hypothetical protein
LKIYDFQIYENFTYTDAARILYETNDSTRMFLKKILLFLLFLILYIVSNNCLKYSQNSWRFQRLWIGRSAFKMLFLGFSKYHHQVISFTLHVTIATLVRIKGRLFNETDHGGQVNILSRKSFNFDWWLLM